MSSTYGRNVRISIFGQSHSEAIGVVIDGLPAGFAIDFDELNAFMARRAPGQDGFSTGRREADLPEVLSGLSRGKTCGAPLALAIRNLDARPADYAGMSDVPRPGHADYTAHIKYRGAQDVSGGGHFSGRLTAPLCLAGGICLQLLRRESIEIAAHILAVGGVFDRAFDPVSPEVGELNALRASRFPVLDEARGERMREEIERARRDGDSLGGVVECAAVGVPAGLGDPMFDGMENRIAAAVFAIPAVKGVEFGSGFAGSARRGSENNDAFYFDGGGVKTRTNNHGGILGGITSGMPVVFRVAVKPTPSIAKRQESVSLRDKTPAEISVLGRHDPCIAPRAVPCVEAAAAIAIYDALLDERKYGL